LEQRKLRKLDSGDGVLSQRRGRGGGSMRDTRATFGWARLKLGWPEEGRRQLGLVTAVMFRHVEGRRSSVRWSKGFLEVM
jgi:hypothetical protein